MSYVPVPRLNPDKPHSMLQKVSFPPASQDNSALVAVKLATPKEETNGLGQVGASLIAILSTRISL